MVVRRTDDGHVPWRGVRAVACSREALWLSLCRESGCGGNGFAAGVADLE